MGAWDSWSGRRLVVAVGRSSVFNLAIQQELDFKIPVQVSEFLFHAGMIDLGESKA